MRLAVQLALPLAALAQLQPFTLTQTEGPTGGPTRTITTSRSSIGSQVVRYISPDQEPAGVSPRTVTRADLGKRFMITGELGLISTYYLMPREVTALKTANASPICDPGFGAILSGQDHLAGVLAFRYDNFVNGGVDRHSHWYAPSLNCLAIQYAMHTLESGRWKRMFSRVPTRLDLSAPRDEDFLIPTSYREVPPSEHQKAAIARKRGAPFGSHPNDAALQNTFERLDRHYHESQQFKPTQ